MSTLRLFYLSEGGHVNVGAVALELVSALQHDDGAVRHVGVFPQSRHQPLPVQRVQGHRHFQRVLPQTERRSAIKRTLGERAHKTDEAFDLPADLQQFCKSGAKLVVVLLDLDCPVGESKSAGTISRIAVFNLLRHFDHLLLGQEIDLLVLMICPNELVIIHKLVKLETLLLLIRKQKAG